MLNQLNKEDYIINITTIANFLSIDSKEIDDIEEVNIENECTIYIKLKRNQHSCPFCREEQIEIKEWKTRKIKHALFYAKSTTFVLKIPRYKCRVCSKTFTGQTNYAPKRSRKSYDLIILVLKDLMKYNETNSSIAERYHISPTTVQNIFDTYVNYQRKSLPRVLSIDEFYNGSQFIAPYSVILFDFIGRRIVDVVQDRKKHNLSSYFGKMTREERNNVKYVVMDMWEPYLDICKTHFPNAIVAIDSFHVMQNLGRAVDDVRCRIMRGYGKTTEEYYLLKKYGYLLMKSPKMWDEKIKNKKLHKYVNEYDILTKILAINKDLRTVHEYYLKYQYFNEHSSHETARENYDDVALTINGEIPNELIPIFAMFSNWKEEILNSFIIVDGIRLSNGPTEGVNSQIKKLMRVGNGFANFQRFRNRVMHCYNKELIISPVKEKIKKIPGKKRGKYKKSAKT